MNTNIEGKVVVITGRTAGRARRLRAVSRARARISSSAHIVPISSTSWRRSCRAAAAAHDRAEVRTHHQRLIGRGVVVRDEQAQSGQRGFVVKKTVQETRQHFDVTSYHPVPITVEVVDQIPVSRNADAHVEILKGITDPTVSDFEGKPGLVLWKLEAPPQKVVSLHHFIQSDIRPAGNSSNAELGSRNSFRGNVLWIT